MGKNIRFVVISVIVINLVAAVVEAEVRLPNIFGDGMVLQRGKLQRVTLVHMQAQVIHPVQWEST